jgi:hypothetical protein
MNQISKYEQRIGGMVVKEWGARELGFGEILDVGFRTLKENIGRMLLICFIIWLPAIIISLTAHLTSGIFSLSMDFLSLIVIVVAYVLSTAAVLLIVRDVRQEKESDLWEIGQQALARFWPMLGATICFGLLIVGSVFLLLFVLTIVGVAGALGNLSMLMSGDIFGSLGLVAILILVAYMCGLVFFMTRLGFHLPAVLFGTPAPGLSRSWRLTENNVWRLIGLFLVIFLVMMIILTPVFILLELYIDPVFVVPLLTEIINVICMVVGSAVLAVIYFDLIVRNEGGDLLAMAAAHDQGLTEHQTASIAGVTQPESAADAAQAAAAQAETAQADAAQADAAQAETAQAAAAQTDAAQAAATQTETAQADAAQTETGAGVAPPESGTDDSPEKK